MSHHATSYNILRVDTLTLTHVYRDTNFLHVLQIAYLVSSEME